MNNEILENKQVNGLEIYFNEKPTQDIINKLKEHHFRWHTAKKCWYNKLTEDNKNFAISITDANGITEDKTETPKNTTKKQYNTTSDLKYLLNGIRDKNGKYFKCYYNFDYLTYEIIIHSDSYGDLPTPTDTTGLSYIDNTDFMTDYFEKPTIKLAPTNSDYLSAFENLINLQDKKKNYSFTLTNEIINNAKKLALTMQEDKDQGLKNYTDFVERKRQEQEKQKELDRIEDNKNYIKHLQDECEKIKNGKYSYYDSIREDENYITALSVEKYNIIDFTPNCMDKEYVDYHITTINKKDFSRTDKKFDNIEDLDEYLNTIYNN